MSKRNKERKLANIAVKKWYKDPAQKKMLKQYNRVIERNRLWIVGFFIVLFISIVEFVILITGGFK